MTRNRSLPDMVRLMAFSCKGLKLERWNVAFRCCSTLLDHGKSIKHDVTACQHSAQTWHISATSCLVCLSSTCAIISLHFLLAHRWLGFRCLGGRRRQRLCSVTGLLQLLQQGILPRSELSLFLQDLCELQFHCVQLSLDRVQLDLHI